MIKNTACVQLMSECEKGNITKRNEWHKQRKSENSTTKSNPMKFRATSRHSLWCSQKKYPAYSTTFCITAFVHFLHFRLQLFNVHAVLSVWLYVSVCALSSKLRVHSIETNNNIWNLFALLCATLFQFPYLEPNRRYEREKIIYYTAATSRLRGDERIVLSYVQVFAIV